MKSPRGFPASVEVSGHPGGQLISLDHDRYLALQFAPADLRGDLTAIFGLDIALGRVGHLVSEPLTGEMRLAWWRQTLAAAKPGQKTGNPLADRVTKAILAHNLPLASVETMIEARRLQLYRHQVADLDELASYFADTLGTALDLACQVLGPAPHRRLALCRQAGLALGLAQLIGQLAGGPVVATPWLAPADIMAKLAGAPMHQSLTPSLQDQLVAELIAKARCVLDELQSQFKNLPTALLPVFLPLNLVAGDLARYAQCSATSGKFASGLPRYRRVIKLASRGLRGRLL